MAEPSLSGPTPISLTRWRIILQIGQGAVHIVAGLADSDSVGAMPTFCVSFLY